MATESALSDELRDQVAQLTEDLYVVLLRLRDLLDATRKRDA